MSEMWSYAAEDTEADLARRYLSHARTAAAHSWAFVLAATSPEEYTHRETLMGDSFDKAVTAAVGDDVGYFLDTRVAMITELAEDFATVQTQRAHEASLQAAAAAKRAEAERRAIQVNAAFEEILKTAGGPTDEDLQIEHALNLHKSIPDPDCPACKKAKETKTSAKDDEDDGDDSCPECHADWNRPDPDCDTCGKWAGAKERKQAELGEPERTMCAECGTARRNASTGYCPNCAKVTKESTKTASSYLEVGPAYGRDYKSIAAVQADWDAGKDFVVLDMGPDEGRYINKQDAPAGTTIMVRYKNMTEIRQIKSSKTAGVFDGPEDYGNDPYADRGDPFYVNYTCPKCGTTGSSRISDNSAGRPICHGCGNDIPAEAITTGKRYLSRKTKTAGERRGAPLDWTAGTTKVESYPGLTEEVVIWEAHSGDYDLMIFMHPATGYTWSVYPASKDTEIASGPAMALDTAKLAAEAAVPTETVGQMPLFAKKAAWSEDDDEFDDSTPEECPVCDGPGRELGTLGNLTHYRCENCGWEWSEDYSSDGRYPQADDLSFESARTAKRYQVWDNAAPKYSPGTPGTLVAEFDDLNLARRKLVEYGDWVGWDGVEMIDTQEGTPHQISNRDSGPDIVVSSTKTPDLSTHTHKMASFEDICKNCRYPITLDGENWYHTRTGLVECQDKKPEPGPNEATPADK